METHVAFGKADHERRELRTRSSADFECITTLNVRPPRVYMSHVSRPTLFRAHVASPANVSYVKFTGCAAEPSNRELADL